MTLWFWLLGVPLILLGAAAVMKPTSAAAALTAFPRSRLAGRLLCALAWLGTAYECDNFGVDVFDNFLKVFPGEVWVLAAVLTVLTCMWMENLLPLRALCGIFMLFPAELFPAVRMCDSAWRLTLVTFAYLCAIGGMFGMFYPWRFRQLLTWLAAKPRQRLCPVGAAALGTGCLFAVLGAIVN